MDTPSEGARSEREPQDTYTLIDRFRGGDRDAGETLMTRYRPRIHGLVERSLGAKLRARDAVSDVVQLVCLRVLKGLETFDRRGDARFMDLVTKMTRYEIANRARDGRAAKRNRPTVPLEGGGDDSQAGVELADDASGVVTNAERRELYAILLERLSDLPAIYREVIVRRKILGASWRAISERLGRSPAACEELCRRAVLRAASLVPELG